MKRLRLLLAVAVLVVFAGCQTVPERLAIDKSAAEKQIAALKADFEGKLEAQKIALETATKALLTAQEVQMKAAANSFYSLGLVYDTITTPTRTDLIWHNYSLEGWSALGNRMPDYATMQAANERLKKDLDESHTSLADLKATHDAVLAANQQLVDATKKWETAMEGAKKALNDLKADYSAKLTAKQDELVAIQGKLIIAEKARSDDAVAIQKLKTKISSICGLIALACVAAAIWLPIAKPKAIITGVIAGLAGAAIWVIPGWVVLAAVAVAIAIVVFFLLRDHNKDSKALDGLVLGIEDIKTQAPEKWEEIKGYIEERLKKYVKDPATGETVAVPDTKMAAHIDSKLVEWDAK